MIVYYYPNCGTCKKALKWLENQGVQVELKHIVEETPSVEILSEIYQKSGLPIQKLFNTSGKKYQELNMKEQLKKMTDEEALSLLSGEGMLIKRPLVLADDFALVGFKVDEWEKKINGSTLNGGTTE